MKKYLMFLGLFFALTLVGLCSDQDLRSATETMDEVEQILGKGLPTIAIAKLDLIESSDWSAPEKSRLATLSARAHLFRSEPESALEALLPYKDRDQPESDFWLGETYAALREPSLAKDYYRACIEDPHFGRDARIGLARMLAALDKEDEALEVLQGDSSDAALLEKSALHLDLGHTSTALELLDQPQDSSSRRDYLRARAALAQGDKEGALVLLRQAGNHQSIANKGDRALLMARLELDLGRPDMAEETLETFIEQNPLQSALPEAFALLDEVYARGASPTVTEMRRWADGESHPARAELALFYLARNEARLGNDDRAVEAYERFLSRSADNPLSDRARSELSELWLADGNPKAALEVLQDGRHVDFSLGLAKAAVGDYAEAAAHFEAAALSSDSPEASYNMALCQIMAEGTLPLTVRTFLPDERTALEQALAFSLVARRDAAASEVLEQLLNSGTSTPAIVLALAEWEFLNGEFLSAKNRLQTISNSDPGASERAAALTVFLEDSGSSEGEPRAIEAAEKFLATYPDSALAPSVALKLGEIFFRRGDYLSAREQFDFVVDLPEAGPLAEKALFLAAQSAARSMDEAGMEEAIEIYDDVARREGPLALRARLAQAMLLNARDRRQEAIAVLDNILAGEPDLPLRLAAIIEKGDTLFASGEEDPAAFREAIAIWRLADQPSSPARWRNQALVKIGAASERLEEFPAALSSYYDVLSSPRSEDPEHFWYFKAGFDAARLLESDGRFDEAAAIYEKLAAEKGPRSEEAGQRLNRLKLENFLWED